MVEEGGGGSNVQRGGERVVVSRSEESVLSLASSFEGKEVRREGERRELESNTDSTSFCFLTRNISFAAMEDHPSVSWPCCQM